MVSIYILELEHNKYYVGKSNNINARILEHFTTTSTAWTNKYKPVKLIEIIPNCDDFDEDKYTLMTMKKYGIDNVRGGSFSRIKLSQSNIEMIIQMIKGSSDLCYICGSKVHFANDCDNNNMVTNIYNSFMNTLNYCIACERCGRFGHIIEDCYANTYNDGQPIDEVYLCKYCNDEFDNMDDMIDHEMYCK